MPNETASQRIAEWIGQLRFEAIPDVAVARTRDALINTLGTAIGGARLPSVAHAMAYTKSQAGPGASTVLVTGERWSASGAAFVNAVMVNALGQEETHGPTGIHPIETTLPVALAVAEESGHSGPELIRALVVGTEVAVALASMSLTPPVKYDACQAPAVYGTIGGTAALCALMELSPDQTVHALGLAANFSAGLSECIRQGTGEYHYLKGLAATHAHLAATLAASGAKSAPTTFEGDGGFFHLFAQVPREELRQHDVAEDVGSALGRDWACTEFIYKPYPVHYFNQVFVDGALRLRASADLDVEDITSVEIEVDQRATGSGAALMPPFERRENALGSTSFCVAAALARGQVTLQEISDGEAPDILRLTELTTVTESSDSEVAVLKVVAGDHVFEFDGASDGPDYRLSGDDLYKIFHACSRSELDEPARMRLLDVLLGIERCDDVRAVLPLLVTDSQAQALR